MYYPEEYLSITFVTLKKFIARCLINSVYFLKKLKLNIFQQTLLFDQYKIPVLVTKNISFLLKITLTPVKCASPIWSHALHGYAQILKKKLPSHRFIFICLDLREGRRSRRGWGGSLPPPLPLFWRNFFGFSMWYTSYEE